MSQHSTFRKLVTNDDDFVGMVAYTIYKNDKLNWIDSFTSARGRQPTFQEIQSSFNVNSDSDQKVQQYLRLAETKLNSFIVQTTTVELEQYKQEVLNTFADSKVQNLIDAKLKPSLIGALTPIITTEVNKVNTVAQDIKTEVTPLSGLINSLKPTFLDGVWQNIAATVVTAFIVGIISTGFWFYKFMQSEQNKEALKEEVKNEYGISDEEWNKMVELAKTKAKDKNPA